MERINEVTACTVARWEEAIQNRTDIVFEDMHIHKGRVSGVYGKVVANGKEYAVRWLHDGRCYHQGKRAQNYDIAL